jgi:hypothetical protein
MGGEGYDGVGGGEGGGVDGWEGAGMGGAESGGVEVGGRDGGRWECKGGGRRRGKGDAGAGLLVGGSSCVDVSIDSACRLKWGSLKETEVSRSEGYRWVLYGASVMRCGAIFWEKLDVGDGAEDGMGQVIVCFGGSIRDRMG